MLKDILLYGSIDSWSSQEVIQAIIDSESEEISMRINSPGGDVQYGWGIIAKLSELKGKLLLKNDGKAHSMAAYMFCYADDAEAIDTAEFIFHRAAYASWIECDPEMFDEATQGALLRINTSLRKALEAKIDVAAFEALKGITMKDLFSIDGRLEVTLTAKEAKSVGLINRVVAITPKKKAEISAFKMEMSAKYTGFRAAAKVDDENKNPKDMTIEEIQTKFPAAFAAIKAIGAVEGAKAEKDRVGSFLAYAEIDLKAVKAGIASGVVMTETERSEFAVKVISAKSLAEVTDDGTKSPLKTKEELAAEVKTAEAKKIEEFSALVDKNLGLNKKPVAA